MTTISFAGARGSAPGTFVYERTAGVNTPRAASFDTVYLPVEVDNEVSPVIFPFNTPVPINSLNDYLALIGNITPVDKWQNLSLQCVQAIFKNAGTGDVRVVRLTAPISVSEISFDPSANKVGASAEVAPLVAGDVIYIQLSFNGIQLGESDSLGTYKGVAVTIPESYQSGQTEINRAISLAIAEAVQAAIAADPEINSAIYVRNVSIDTSEVVKLRLASRTYGAEVSVVFYASTFSGGYVLSADGYSVQELVNDGTLSYYDYAQAISTAFDGGELPQGYLIAPTGFAKFNRLDRIRLGQLMEEVVSAPDKKWIALVDPGAYELNSIEEYSDFVEHEAALGFISQGEYLINNNLVKWLGVDYEPNSALYVSSEVAASANTGLAQGTRLALRDDQDYYVTAADNTTEKYTLAENWSLPSGTSVQLVELDGATLPAGLLAQTYYAIASDVDGSLAANEIKLALSYSDAINGTAVLITSDGVANPGGNVFLLVSAVPAWEFPQTIKGVTSELIEVTNPAGTSFNLHNAPATLQRPTDTLYLKAVYRQFDDPAAAGLSDDNGDALFTVVSHSLVNREKVYFESPITTGSGAGNVVAAGTAYYVVKQGVDTFKLATSESNYNAGIYVSYAAPDAGQTDIKFYSELKAATQPGQFFPLTNLSILKGRKYQIDATSVGTVLKDSLGNALTGGLRIQQYAVESPAVGDFSFGYLEDENAAPLSQANPLEGYNNFLCVPAGKADTDTYLQMLTFDGTATYTLTGENLRLVYANSNAPVPDSLWNVKAVSSSQLLDEALRVGNAEILETGVQNHSQLLQDARNYSTQAGFLAYYGPEILNDNGVWVPPSPYVVGLALRRYRDEGGFQSPPAGTKYALLGARDVRISISTDQQNLSNPFGMNAIRKLPGYGDQIFVWGGRTRVNASNPEEALFQFVNTRVIMNVLYGTLKTAFDNRIFSTSESPTVLFNEIRSLASSVLYNFYVSGYLFGNTPQDAYEVILDERNNPKENLENGLLNVQIFAVPATVTERIEVDLFRVAVGNVAAAVSERGF